MAPSPPSAGTEAERPCASRSLREPLERERRAAALGLPHIAPLAAYAASLRQRRGSEVPDFDPFDGGTGARLLFLLEKPGPMTAVEGRGRRAGSGFISRDNDDPTAAAVFLFMQEAGIARRHAVLWNAIPWWNGTRRIEPAELTDGAAATLDLLRLLPQLRAIVLVGRRAQRIAPLLKDTHLPIFASAHPSPLVRARQPAAWLSIADQWRSAGALAAEAQGSLEDRGTVKTDDLRRFPVA